MQETTLVVNVWLFINPFIQDEYLPCLSYSYSVGYRPLSKNVSFSYRTPCFELPYLTSILFLPKSNEYKCFSSKMLSVKNTLYHKASITSLVIGILCVFELYLALQKYGLPSHFLWSPFLDTVTAVTVLSGRRV